MAITTANIPDRILSDLHGRGRLRVWSIIVSAFGDLIDPRDVAMPAPVLQDLMERLQIKPGAVRTAISRLVDDGWIDRLRDGRNVAYRLTKPAAAESDVAAARIYAGRKAADETLAQIVILPETARPEPAGMTRLRRGLYVSDGSASLPEDALVFSGVAMQVPDWAREAIAPAELAGSFRQIETLFSPLLSAASVMPAADAAACRVLLIHYWRRIALRHPELPASMAPPNWPGDACHQLVAKLYTVLSWQMEDWLNECIPGAIPSSGRFES
ncbi:MAG: PaaX family transcriptional regulator C-terminal domain-containing protein [Pseudomonadota bacterium]